MNIAAAYFALKEDLASISRADLLDRALDGEPGAGTDAAMMLRSELRGFLVALAYKDNAPKNTMAEIVEAVWNHEHYQMIHLAGSPQKLIRWFKRCRFDTSALPETFDVWRGVSDPAHVAHGYSWTTDRDIACWFACRYSSKTPLVVKRTVTRKQVVYYSNERHEQEVVLSDFAPGKTDGDIADWRAGLERNGEKIRSRNAAILAGA